MVDALSAELGGTQITMPDLADEATLVLLADEAGAGVGFLSAQFDGAPGERSGGAVIEAVYVRPSHRRRSVGTRLVTRFEEVGIERGCAQACVDVPISAPGAQDFFQQFGFSVRTLGRAQVLQAGKDRYTINDEEPWYSVRCHFAMADERPFDYEERITLWCASSSERAMEFAKAEARRYAEFNGYRYLNACTCYHLSDSGFAVSGKEIWSEMRRSTLEPDAYLDRYFFTGGENSS